MNRETDIYQPARKGYVVLDIESQGYVRFSPIEISAVRFSPDGECLDACTSLVRPRAWHVNPRVTELTGITTDMVRDAPPPSKVMPMFRNFIGKSVIVGHAVGANDIPIIEHFYNIFFHVPFDNPYVDTFYWAQALFPDLGTGHYNLKALAEHFHIESEVFHRAEADCFTTASLYRILHAHAVSLTMKERRKLMDAFLHRNDPKEPEKAKGGCVDYNALPLYDGRGEKAAVIKLWHAREALGMELRFPGGFPDWFDKFIDDHVQCLWSEFDKMAVADRMPSGLASDLLKRLRAQGYKLYRKDAGVFSGLEYAPKKPKAKRRAGAVKSADLS